MARKQRNPRYVTSVGEAVFPHLVEPDYEYVTEGSYHTKLKLPADSQVFTAKGESLGSLAEWLEAMHAASVEKAKKDPKNEGKKIKAADLPLEELEDGSIQINVKLKASGVKRDTKEPFYQKPAFFDAKGKPFTPDRLWGGSKIKVAFECNPFYTRTVGAGISLRLKAVQVIELNAGSSDGGSFGFGEEDGFEAEDTPAEENGFGDNQMSDDDDIPGGAAPGDDGDF